MTIQKPPRILKSGEFAFVRCKIKGPSNITLGEYEVEPITITGDPMFEGKYIYVMIDEIVTVSEARKAMRA